MNQPLHPEIREVLKTLIDKLFFIVFSLGIIAITASIVRTIHFGWHAGIIANIITFITILVILGLRNRLPYQFTFWAIIAATSISGLFTLFSLGLAGTALTVFTATAILISTFYGWRPGIVAVAIAVAFILAYRGAIALGIVPYPAVDLEGLLRAPASWITQALTFAAYTVSVIFAVNTVLRRLVRSVSELHTRTGELQDTVSKLRESEEIYRLLSENVSDVVVVQDMDLKVRYFSPSVEKMFGYSTEEIREQSMKDWLTPESLHRAFANYQECLAKAAAGPVAIPLMEYEYRRKDGSTFWGELRTVFLYDADGNMTGSQSTIRDITERKKNEEERRKLEEQLVQNEKMRIIGQLAGGVAHDFNNQLAGMMGFADLIKRHEQTTEPLAYYAERIVTAARRSADLTSKLLAFAHRGKIRSEPIDMHALIGETVAILERSLDKRINISQKLDAADHIVIGDQTQMQNALLNLGLNARDAMPGGGTMTIATSGFSTGSAIVTDNNDTIPPGDYLKIEVIDTGHGIEPETLPHVFEPFFTTKEKSKGTGMGLPAVQGTIRNHKGWVTIRSAKENGTVVTLLLPVARGETACTTIPKTAAADAPGASGAILVIDDEPLVLQVARLALEKAGYTVTTFENPAEAVDWYRERHRAIDLVIVDMIMPQMDGKAALIALHAINPGLRAIVCSGYNQNHRMEQLRRFGALAFVQKPFDTIELAEAVSRVLASVPESD